MCVFFNYVFKLFHKASEYFSININVLTVHALHLRETKVGPGVINVFLNKLYIHC